MSTDSILNSGPKGTKKLVAVYGDQLVCLRYSIKGAKETITDSGANRRRSGSGSKRNLSRERSSMACALVDPNWNCSIALREELLARPYPIETDVPTIHST